MNGWVIYDRESLKRNISFAKMLISEAEKLNIDLCLMIAEELDFNTLPDFAIMRSYDCNISKKLENLGVKVFNSSKVSEVCNDKMNTYLFFKDKNIPLMETKLLTPDISAPYSFPFVVKPVDGHGGDGVTLVSDENEYKSTLKALQGRKIIAQKKASDAGKDLRVYIIGNKIIAGMLRVSENDFRSNFSLGGKAYVHTLSKEEEKIIEAVTDNMYFDFAGIDLIYNDGKPVLNEIEDVVGSRMLYANTDIDVCKLYIQYIKKAV